MEEEQKVYTKLNRQTKWLGIIDYKSLTILIAFVILIWFGMSLVITNLVTRIYILILLIIPVIGMFYAHSSSESVVDVILVVAKYIFSPKRYVYKIESRDYWLK